MHGISHQLLCFHQHQDFLFAARNCNTLLQFMQHAITVAVYTVCNTPAVVFGANRTIMRSLLDLRQLRLSASCLCKSSLLHLFKICEFMKYDSINLILRQSLKSLISGSCSLNRRNPKEVAPPFPAFLSAFIKQPASSTDLGNLTSVKQASSPVEPNRQLQI